MKKLLAILLLGMSPNLFAAYTLVFYSSSVNYMNTLTVHNTQEQCEKAKANFETTFSDKLQGKKVVFECIDIANGSI